MNRFLIVWLSGFGILLAQVDTAWVRRYNGTGNGQDCAKSIVVDNAGNVYVTGYSV
ncbi:MAG: SBBP repeat-containing protein [candidate division WOR-3 bacterium]